MKTATPFPWTGPAAAGNIRTGFRSIFEPAPRPAARCNPQGARLPEQAYSAVVIDQFLRENEPAEGDQVLEHPGTAFPLPPQLRNSWQGAVGARSRSALHRRKREETQARRAVKQPFRSEMCESLTSMLLSCELAMPGPAAEKIRAVDDLAREMRLRAN